MRTYPIGLRVRIVAATSKNARRFIGHETHIIDNTSYVIIAPGKFLPGYTVNIPHPSGPVTINGMPTQGMMGYLHHELEPITPEGSQRGNMTYNELLNNLNRLWETEPV